MDGDQIRLHRAGGLSQRLSECGHKVTWWTSSFDHFKKRQRFESDQVIPMSENWTIRVLRSRGYKRNVSIARILDHHQIAQSFREAIHKESPPDLIFSAFPTIGLSYVATQFGIKMNVPVLVDIRDLWPDIFVDQVPPFLQPLANLSLMKMRRDTHSLMKQATGLIGISNGYLNWALNYARRPRHELDRLFYLGYEKPSLTEDQISKTLSKLKERGLDLNHFLCLFIGTFGRTYDVETIIAAARQLAQNGTQNKMSREVQFVICGQGENQKLVESASRELKNVLYLGWVNTPEIATLLRSCHVGLAAYAKGAPQGLPNKFFEYLCGGLPLLSTLQGEAKEFLETEGCGLTYEASNAQSLVDGIQKLQNQELRSQFSRNAVRVFDQHFSRHQIYSEMISHFEKTIQRHRSAN